MDKGIAELLKVLIPVLVVLLGAYLAHYYSMKKKRVDDGSEEHKRIRVVLTILLDLWHQFNYLRRLSQVDSPKVNLLFKLPNALTYHLEIDRNEILEKKKQYDNAVLSLQQIDAGLFYKLDKQLDDFEYDFTKTFYPILSTTGLRDRKKSIISDLTNEIVSNLEEKINFLQKRLPRKERLDIKKSLDIGKREFEDELDEIPKYAQNLLNSMLGEYGAIITADTLNKFLENDTVVWLIEKLRIFDFFQSAESELLLLFNLLPENPEDDLNDIDSIPTSILAFVANLKSLRITQEEANEHLVNNREFYEILTGFVNHFDKSPMKIKRVFVLMNNGLVLPQDIITDIQTTIPDIPKEWLET